MDTQDIVSLMPYPLLFCGLLILMLLFYTRISG